MIQSFLAWADKAVEKGDLPSSELFLQSAAREATGDAAKSAMVWVKQGFVADGLSRYADAERHFKKTLDHADKTKDRSLIAPFDRADCFASLGEAFRRQKKLADADQAFSKALASLAEVKVTNVKALLIHTRAAQFHRENGRTVEAKKFEDEAKAVKKEHQKGRADLARYRNDYGPASHRSRATLRQAIGSHRSFLHHWSRGR